MAADFIRQAGYVDETSTPPMKNPQGRHPALPWRGVIPSPITGMDGNQEFLAWITLPPNGIQQLDATAEA